MKELFNKIVGWFSRLFKNKKEKQPPMNKEPKPKRTHNKQKKQDFNELLDGLDLTFNSLKLPSMRESWLDQDSIIGLKKLGVHVPNPWAAEWSKNANDIVLDVSKPLPAIMCIAIPTKDEEDKHYPKVLFAIKHKKLPWNVSYSPGAPYLFGAAFEVSGKLFWVHMYMTVNRKTGVMTMCDELRSVSNVIKANGKTSHYTMKKWTSANFLEDDRRGIEESKISVMNLMRSMHKWWIGREERWNVIVKKNGERITFGVDNKDTPYFFKNRDKVVTQNGETKRIVHYVKEHERTVKGQTKTIKEHIRGLHDFNWNGYQCKVVSPKLEADTAASFLAPADDVEKDLSGTVYLSKVGKLLADFEERKTA